MVMTTPTTQVEYTTGQLLTYACCVILDASSAQAHLTATAPSAATTITSGPTNPSVTITVLGSNGSAARTPATTAMSTAGNARAHISIAQSVEVPTMHSTTMAVTLSLHSYILPTHPKAGA